MGLRKVIPAFRGNQKLTKKEQEQLKKDIATVDGAFKGHKGTADAPAETPVLNAAIQKKSPPGSGRHKKGSK